jgi:hypothetical protein
MRRLAKLPEGSFVAVRHLDGRTVQMPRDTVIDGLALAPAIRSMLGIGDDE